MAEPDFINDAENQIYQESMWYKGRPRVLNAKDLTVNTAQKIASDQYRLVDLVDTLTYHIADVEGFRLLLDRKVAKDYTLISKLDRAGCHIRMRRCRDRIHVRSALREAIKVDVREPAKIRIFSGQEAEAASLLDAPRMSTKLKPDLLIRYDNGSDGVWEATAAGVGTWNAFGSRSGVIGDVSSIFVRVLQYRARYG